MTLTETVFWTKILSKYVIVGLTLVIAGYFVYVFYFIVNPPVVFTPNYKCGVIAPPELVAQKDADISQAQIQVKSLATALPDASVPSIGYVFKIDIRGETFQTRDTAKLLAQNFDFEPEIFTHEPGSTTYEWNTNKITRSTLIYNTATDNFTYFRAKTLLPKAPNLELPATVFKAPEFAINYFTALGLYSKEFQDGKTFAYPVYMNNNVPYTAASLDEAQLLRIDFQKVTPILFFPKAILSPLYEGDRKSLDYTTFVPIVNKSLADKEREKYTRLSVRRVGQTPETSNVQLYMSSQMVTPGQGIYQLSFNNWKVEEAPCGTYPLKKPSEVISRISKGEGTIVLLVPDGGDKLNPISTEPVKDVNLYNMELVYYESNVVQQYLQPIYVVTGQVIFQNGGKGEIAIYVPAINYESFTQNTQQ